MFRRNPVAALAVAYAALAVLVAAGALSRIDQWSIDHLMQGLRDNDQPTAAEALVPLLGAHWHTALDDVANLVTLPAQALISTALVGVACLVLRRRGRVRAALVWGAVWVAGNAVEVLCKSVLERPLLHAHVAALRAFESSWPSGHALRSVLLAATVAAVWPRASTWAAAWAAASLVLLEVAGFHVPSDIAGGVLLALLLVVVARRAARPRS